MPLRLHGGEKLFIILSTASLLSLSIIKDLALLTLVISYRWLKATKDETLDTDDTDCPRQYHG